MGGVARIPLRFVLARLLWARSVRRPGALARARLFPAVPVGAGGWGGGAGCAPAPLSGGGRGDHPLCLGGVRAGVPAACGPVGGLGGRSRRGLPAPPLGGGPGFPTLAPFLSSAHSRLRSVGVAGPPHAPGADCLAGGGGMRGGPWTAPPGAPSDLPLPSQSGQWSWRGHKGRSPHTVLARRRVPPPGLVRAPLRGAGAGSPVSRDPRGSRRLGALGRAVCRSSRIPPPPPRVAVPSGGGGASPRLQGGGGSLLWPSSWGGSRGVGGWGGRSAAPRPPTPSGVDLPSVLSGAPPRGILVPWGLPGGRGRRARPGRPPMGQCGRGGGGGGGGDPPAVVRTPAFPRPASEGAAPFALSWAPPVRRQSAAGRAGACGRFTGGACRGRGAPPPWVQRPLRGGCRAAVSSACPRPLLGLRGRKRGGGKGPLVPWLRPLTAAGERPGGPGTGGQL